VKPCSTYEGAVVQPTNCTAQQTSHTSDLFQHTKQQRRGGGAICQARVDYGAATGEWKRRQTGGHAQSGCANLEPYGRDTPADSARTARCGTSPSSTAALRETEKKKQRKKS